ncbi:MAG: glycosyltransferase [Methanothrix sp.]|nr:glycosyltransferase [Methanothrix sp.]
MTNNPLVSIITPTYNHEKFIAQCLESVLAQTYPDWEQIVIDDGSDDRTGDIISQYSDKRIKHIRQENKGIWRLGETYNEALRLSKGDYIAILEGDDFWPPDKLEIQMRSFRRTDAVLSWGRAKVVDSHGDLLAILPKDVKSFQGLSKEQVLGQLLLSNPFMYPCTIICRKSALLSIGGFKQTKDAPYVDGPTWLELSLIGEFLPVDDVLAYYRKHDNQISFTKKASMINAGLYSIEFFNNLPEDVRTSVEKTVDDLDAKLKRKKVNSYYYLGRAYLREGNFSLSRRNFSEAICKGDSVIKAKAMLGLICLYFGIDLERLAEVYDRRNPKDR